MGFRDKSLTVTARRLRRIQEQLRTVFRVWSYDEVITPSLVDYEVFRTGNSSDNRGMYKLIDENGEILVLKPDMTTPIARLAAVQWSEVPRPLRVSYFTRLFRRVVRGDSRAREFFQAGVELIGLDEPEADAEVVALACEALRTVGLKEFQVNIGHNGLLQEMLSALRLTTAQEHDMRVALQQRDLVGVHRVLEAPGAEVPEALKELLLPFSSSQQPGEQLELLQAAGINRRLVDSMGAILDLLESYDLGTNVRLDIALVRDLDYYTGAVFEIYSPATGGLLGGGGRYDDLIGAFGRPEVATGFALELDQVADALAARVEHDIEPPSYLIISTAPTVTHCVECAKRLRARGHRTVINMHDRLPAAEQAMAEAAASGFERVVVVRQDGTEARYVSGATGESAASVRSIQGGSGPTWLGNAWETHLSDGIH